MNLNSLVLLLDQEECCLVGESGTSLLSGSAGDSGQLQTTTRKPGIVGKYTPVSLFH